MPISFETIHKAVDKGICMGVRAQIFELSAALFLLLRQIPGFMVIRICLSILLV